MQSHQFFSRSRKQDKSFLNVVEEISNEAHKMFFLPGSSKRNDAGFNYSSSMQSQHYFVFQGVGSRERLFFELERRNLLRGIPNVLSTVMLTCYPSMFSLSKKQENGALFQLKHLRVILAIFFLEVGSREGLFITLV
jgi:hypothetical protein